MGGEQCQGLSLGWQRIRRWSLRFIPWTCAKDWRSHAAAVACSRSTARPPPRACATKQATSPLCPAPPGVTSFPDCSMRLGLSTWPDRAMGG